MSHKFQIRIIVPTLGDMVNGFPAFDALAKAHGKFPMILPIGMKIFTGIKEFIEYQDFTSSVKFEDEVTDGSNILIIHELPVMMFKLRFAARSKDIHRPFMTCHVETYLKEQLKLDFQIDDAYQLKVKPVTVNAGDKIWAGDRWAQTTDHRRAHTMLGHFSGLTFLDWKQTIFHNMNLIAQSKYPFVSTFTGVSILADLINKPNVVLWNEDMRNFMGWSPEFSFRKHYFSDRASYIQYIGDFKESELKRI